MKRKMGVDSQEENAVSNHGLPWMNCSCQLLLYRSRESGCSGVRTGWFMSCCWLRTNVESCQIDCCLIILVWRVRYCGSDYTHTNIHTRTHRSPDRQSRQLKHVQIKMQKQKYHKFTCSQRSTEKYRHTPTQAPKDTEKHIENTLTQKSLNDWL